MRLPVTIFLLFLVLFCSAQQKEESLIFPYQQLHVHGPTIVELPSGDLLSAWFEGSGERWADDVAIMGARLKKGEIDWSEPFLMADVPGFPDINPMLFMDTRGKLWLMWYTVLANQWESSLPKYRISSNFEGDGAPIWEWQEVLHIKPGDKTEQGIQEGDRFVEAINAQLNEYETYLKKEIYPNNPGMEERFASRWPGLRNRIDSLARGKNQTRKGQIQIDGKIVAAQLGYPISRRLGWQTKNKPFILNEKRLIVPFYSDGLSCALFAITDDWGKNWQFSNPVIGGGGIQATIAIKKNGTLVAYMRDNGPAPKRIQYTESKDDGLTWSIPRDTELLNSGAGFDMVSLKNGNWILVFNNLEEGRYNLTVALSNDEGKTWKWQKNLENDLHGKEATSFHYPAVIEGKDGRIHTVYSYHRKDAKPEKKTVKWMSFDMDWLQDK